MKKMPAHTIADLIENFGLLDDWEDRYQYLIDLGNQLEPMDKSLMTETNIVRGCTSKVWMTATREADGAYRFISTSDASIVRGLIYILLAAFNGRTAAGIKAVDIESSFQKMGLEQHLSPNRRNGFYAMIERIRQLGQG